MRRLNKMLYLHLLSINSLLNITSASEVQVLQSTAKENFFLDTLRKIFEEKPFQTILILQAAADQSCISTNRVWHHLQIPLLLSSSSITSADELKNHFNSELLTVICFAESLDFKLLNVMAANLQYMRHTRIIIHMSVTKPWPRLLDMLCSYLEEQKMTNVIVIFNDFYTHAPHFYRYYPFPSGHWAAPELLDNVQRYFSVAFNDLQGKQFTTLPAQSAPRIIVFEDAAGEQHLSGYIGHLMVTLAEKNNFTWQYLEPVTPGQGQHLFILVEHVAQGTLDFAISLASANYDMKRYYPLISYPVEIIEWFIILPCPQPLKYSEIYTVLMTTEVMGILVILEFVFSLLDNFMQHICYERTENFNLLNILVNENTFRGIFGLPFLLRRHSMFSLKLLYFCLFVLGLFVNNMYSAYFQTLFTTPPLKQRLLTFDDLRRANLKIMFNRNEIQGVKDIFGIKFDNTFKDIVQLEDTEIFRRHRQEYDTTYAYTMPESLWPIFELQQQTFERKLFCLAPTLKFFDRIPLGIPLAENSYLKEPLNELILRVFETGIFEKWRRMTFIDMRRLEKLSLNVNSSRELVHVIRVEDMKMPWYLLVCGLCTSSVVFIVEHCVCQWKRSSQKKI